MYPGIPRNTEHWDNLYKHRVYIERTIFLLKDCFGLDSLREDAVEEFDQFNCVDDVSDDDILECYPFFSFVEIYTYDSRKNQDDRYKLIY